MDYFPTKDSSQIAFQYVAGSQSPIAFIHGAHIASNEWQPQGEVLKDRSHLLIDLRGHGQSDKKGYPYSIGQFADDIGQLLAHLQINDVIVCGHSLGGMVAQQVAVNLPDKVSGLILVDTSFGVRSNRLESFLTDVTLPLFNLLPPKTRISTMANQTGKYSETTKAYLQEEFEKFVPHKQNYNEIWRAVTEFDGFEQLAEIKCKTLVVAGKLNKQTHRQAEVMGSRIPNSRLVYIENAGHMVNWDNPEQFNRVLREFVT